MLDTEYTLDIVNQVIKKDIIPSLDDGVAKEQAIAMISVLKNVNANTQQNLKPYIEVNELLQTGLTEIFAQMNDDDQLTKEMKERIVEYQTQLNHMHSIDDIQNRWKALNTLFSEVIKTLYEEPDHLHAYIGKCRTLLRRQLDIESRLVK